MKVELLNTATGERKFVEFSELAPEVRTRIVSEMVIAQVAQVQKDMSGTFERAFTTWRTTVWMRQAAEGVTPIRCKFCDSAGTMPHACACRSVCGRTLTEREPCPHPNDAELAALNLLERKHEKLVAIATLRLLVDFFKETGGGQILDGIDLAVPETVAQALDLVKACLDEHRVKGQVPG